MNWFPTREVAISGCKYLILSMTLVLLTAGCSAFRREWRAAAATPAPAKDIQGRWEGTWSSQTNGHHGRLRCVMSKKADDQYLAFFHANYKRVLSFSYTVPLTAHEADGVFQFQGGADLGKLAGGFYRYAGHATSTNFFSTYQASADGGVFEMKRPGR